MTTALEPEVSTYLWSSHDEADRFPTLSDSDREKITHGNAERILRL